MMQRRDLSLANLTAPCCNVSSGRAYCCTAPAFVSACLPRVSSCGRRLRRSHGRSSLVVRRRSLRQPRAQRCPAFTAAVFAAATALRGRCAPLAALCRSKRAHQCTFHVGSFQLDQRQRPLEGRRAVAVRASLEGCAAGRAPTFTGRHLAVVRGRLARCSHSGRRRSLPEAAASRLGRVEGGALRGPPVARLRDHDGTVVHTRAPSVMRCERGPYPPNTAPIVRVAGDVRVVHLHSNLACVPSQQRARRRVHARMALCSVCKQTPSATMKRASAGSPSL